MDELVKCVFNLPDRLMVDNIDILQDRECCDFGRHSSEEPDVFFSVVSLDIELFIKPRKECLYSFPCLSKRLVE